MMHEEVIDAYLSSAIKNMDANSPEWQQAKSDIHATEPQTVPVGLPIEQAGLFTGTFFNAISTWREGGAWMYGISPADMASNFAPGYQGMAPQPLSEYATELEFERNVAHVATIPGGSTVDIGAIITYYGIKSLDRFLAYVRSKFSQRVRIDV